MVFIGFFESTCNWLDGLITCICDVQKENNFICFVRSTSTSSLLQALLVKIKEGFHGNGH